MRQGKAEVPLKMSGSAKNPGAADGDKHWIMKSERAKRIWLDDGKEPHLLMPETSIVGTSLAEPNRRVALDQENDVRSKLAAEARSWVYTPFHPGSQLKGVAADCAGLVFGTLSTAGLLSKDESKAALKASKGNSYLALPSNEWMLQIAQRLGVQIFEGKLRDAPQDARKAGNVILLRPRTSLVFCHIGILTGGSVVHAYRHCITESSAMAHPYWAGRDVAIFNPFLIPEERPI